MMKNYFQRLHNILMFLLAFYFSGWGECEVSGSMGEWHSGHFQLQIIYSTLNKAVGSFDSNKIDRDSAN
jgi:hypothetical protein